MQIKNKWNKNIIFEAEVKTMKELMEEKQMKQIKLTWLNVLKDLMNNKNHFSDKKILKEFLKYGYDEECRINEKFDLPIRSVYDFQQDFNTELILYDEFN